MRRRLFLVYSTAGNWITEPVAIDAQSTRGA